MQRYDYFKESDKVTVCIFLSIAINLVTFESLINNINNEISGV